MTLINKLLKNQEIRIDQKNNKVIKIINNHSYI